MIQKINYIENSDELAVNLKKAREQAELTQKQVSKMVSIERSSLSCYEIGRSLPSIFTLMKLSIVYHVTLEELLLKH